MRSFARSSEIVNEHERVQVTSPFRKRSCVLTSLLPILCLLANLSAVPIQSPIEIRSEDTLFTALPGLNFLYGSGVTLDVTNTGSPGEESTIRANVSAGPGSLSVGGTAYALTQFHFHTKSEHLKG